MKALVTGGAGFIGSHLVERLTHEGHHVIALDDASTGDWRNLDTVAGRSGVEFVSGSIMDADLMNRLVDSVDQVFHLAAAVGVRRILDDPIAGLRTNLRGTETVLDSALRTGTRVLVMSTSEVYGHNTADSLHEDASRVLGSPLVTRWSYAAAKALDETIAYAYWRYQGLPTVIVRPFNIVGPRQTGHYGMVIPRFVDQALRGEQLTVHGDGSQTRCFCHVSEAVDAVMALAAHPEAAGKAFNIGHPEEVSILELAQQVIALTGSSSTIRFVPYTEAYAEGFEDMHRRVPDITRARELVGFAPTLTLEPILRGVIEHRTSALAAGDAAAVRGEVRRAAVQ
ncbi:UDP-glucose 4-epimerase [Haloechinothrix alba]|uniref:UDP-glucose 4-epimerase n=1 Tax=Haloechinothrix alba TaxID=664784 RepID=A0A238X4Z9_9PSEU|nr:NAD-dependent epimerase/dehydratase family protein [Haloechinothrix alba]SNR53424.1 UDP-glucose 4-epimerase [Haloechinothrix alba]